MSDFLRAGENIRNSADIAVFLAAGLDPGDRAGVASEALKLISAFYDPTILGPASQPPPPQGGINK